jgi:chemotaxis protein CheZ
MQSAGSAPYDRIVGYLREKQKDDPSFSDVMTLAAITAESMQAFCESMDSAVYRELRDIASFIEKMKREIGVFQVNDLKESRIPAAGEELSAVVQATETATNEIMETAEALLAADHTDIDEYRAFVSDNVMKIFEACSFQDITGQRVGKVVETLQMIESRVSRFAEVMNAKDTAGFVSDAEARRAERAENLLLNGPQLGGPATKQSQIDELFGN